MRIINVIYDLGCYYKYAETTKSQQWAQFNDIVQFSGKSINGKTKEDFDALSEYASANNIDIYKLSEDDYTQLEQELFRNDTLQQQKTALEELVEVFSEKSGQ